MSKNSDNIIQMDFSEEMKNSYRDYAMSVIIARALPDVRDGLKPVQRRILFELNKENDECKYNILNFGGGKVEYYDWGFPTQKLGPLKKLKMYSYQKEYRLIAEPIEFTLEPLILNIGDISDISIIGLTKRLIEEIHFNKDKQIVVSGYNF